MALERRDPVHMATRRLSRRLQQADIPHAMMGAFALEAHGGERLRDDVHVLLTPVGLDQFRHMFVERFYNQVPRRSRRFVERQSCTEVEVMLTGHHPGRKGPGPLVYPDPKEVAEKIGQTWVVALPDLIQIRLAAGSYHDLADAVSLIQAHNLDESYLGHLHPSVRDAYLKCLHEKRREEKFWTDYDAFLTNNV
jgi:hypothetical protein